MTEPEPFDPYRPQPAGHLPQPAPAPSWGSPPGQAHASSQPLGAVSTGPTGPFGPHGPGTLPGRGPRASRRSSGVVVTAALMAGVLGGVGGAAAWGAVDGDQGGGVSTAQTLAADGDTASLGSQGVERVAAAVLPSVVKISARTAQGGGSGSGVILSSDGQILTNNHVVADAVGDLTVSFNDGTTAPAAVVGTDPLTDLAVIQARGVSGLDTASLGSSDDVKVGEQVVAVGSPFGLDSTVTSGIVSALDRPVDTGSGGEGSVFPAIQTDAAINPGNSGGALVDLAGDVVGINSAIRTAGSTVSSEGGSIGLGFAIPIDEARPIVAELAEGQTPTHAQIGVSVSDAVGASGVTTGAVIEDVSPGSAADDAGLAEGDVITGVDSEPITGADALVANVRQHRPGDQITLTYEDADGGSGQVQVTLDSDAGTPTA